MFFAMAYLTRLASGLSVQTVSSHVVPKRRTPSAFGPCLRLMRAAGPLRRWRHRAAGGGAIHSAGVASSITWALDSGSAWAKGWIKEVPYPRHSCTPSRQRRPRGLQPAPPASVIRTVSWAAPSNSVTLSAPVDGPHRAALPNQMLGQQPGHSGDIPGVVVEVEGEPQQLTATRSDDTFGP
jgi:hypothetical protein